MSSQNPREQIAKASWSFVEGIKDVVSSNVTLAARSEVKVDADVLAKLLLIVNASIEDGYHRANRSFLRTVDVALEAARSEASVTKKKSA